MLCALHCSTIIMKTTCIVNKRFVYHYYDFFTASYAAPYEIVKLRTRESKLNFIAKGLM